MLLGFHTLHDVKHDNLPRDGLVDIVAVHDVNGDALESWTDPESRVNWLQDFLPQHIRIARVISYGYDCPASALFAHDAADTIQHMAECLVQELHANRQFAGALRRPIIFVCHGLGGVLVKKSLSYSSTRTATKVAHLQDEFVSTFGILFFGTPHGTTSRANWVELSAASSRTSRRSFLPALDRRRSNKDPQVCSSVHVEFSPLLEQFHMFFFWEDLPMVLGNRRDVVVDAKSAAPKLDDTESARIHANHMNMVRFNSKNSSDFRTVIAALATYCEEAPDVISHRWRRAETAHKQLRAGEAWELGGSGPDVHGEEPFRDQDILPQRHFTIPKEASPNFIGRQDILLSLRDAFFPNNAPVILSGRKSYVVFGMGGSGKTELCSRFAEDNRQRYTAVFTIRAASSDSVKESLARIGEQGGLQPTENSGWHVLSQQKEPWLLIIDNADDRALDLRRLFPSGGSAHILITTRVRDFRREGTLGSLELKGLKNDEALQLLLVTAEIAKPWDAPTTDMGNRITEAVGYLALGVIHAGGCVFREVCKLHEYLDIHAAARKELKKEHMPSMVVVKEDVDALSAVYTTFNVSLNLMLKEQTLARRDANDLLKILPFFHFELIPLEVFSRAAAKRINTLANAAAAPQSMASRWINGVLRQPGIPTTLPGFLRGDDGEIDKYRVNWAIAELQSLCFVRSDGMFLSLHPLLHSWARDRLTAREQSEWATIALNTIMESISLPPESNSEADGAYHAALVPHLDAYLSENGDPIPPETASLSAIWIGVAKLFQPAFLYMIRDQVQTAAKCGWVFAERGQFEKAAEHLRMVEKMLTSLLGRDDEKTMSAMLGLAGVCWGLGKLEEAIELQLSVVDTRRRIYGPCDERTLKAMDDLGRSYWLHGQFNEALQLQELTAERARAALGPTHLLTLAALDNLGVTFGAWYRYQESLDIHEEVLRVRVSTVGEDHLETLTTKGNLAMALMDLGHLEEARQAMSDLLELRQKQLGKEHPWTLWALCYLAKIHVESGHYDKAEEMLDWGIPAGIRSLGEDHLGVLMGQGQLSRIYARTGRLEKAEKLSVETVERVAASRGIGHPDCVWGLYKLAQLYVLKDDRDMAIEKCRVGLERAKLRITMEHPIAKDLEALLEAVSTVENLAEIDVRGARSTHGRRG